MRKGKAEDPQISQRTPIQEKPSKTVLICEIGVICGSNSSGLPSVQPDRNVSQLQRGLGSSVVPAEEATFGGRREMQSESVRERKAIIGGCRVE
jgi:hypothetical protein